MSHRLPLVALAALTALAGCVKATPDKVLRVEAAAPAAPRLCERMAGDFDMVLAEASGMRGRLYRVSHADRMISGHGVSWGFRLVDANPEETCQSTAGGVTCEVVGPAELRVQSSAGRATYMVGEGDRATVASEGALLTCHEPVLR